MKQCYTMVEEERWELCDVPDCVDALSDQAIQIVANSIPSDEATYTTCGTMAKRQRDYREEHDTVFKDNSLSRSTVLYGISLRLFFAISSEGV